MMSIRFRLTLLYSTILALTLLIFGLALYSIQARDTLNALKQDLILSSERLVEGRGGTITIESELGTGSIVTTRYIASQKSYHQRE
jgi:hypothetical protein